MPPSYDTTFWPDVIGQSYERRKVHRTIRSPWETAGDQRRSMAGTNTLWAYVIGWNVLARAQAEAWFHAKEFAGDDTAGLYFLEWPLKAESNLVIGTGTGSGSITFDLKSRLKNDSPTDAVLVITRNGTPLTITTDYTVGAVTGVNYREHQVTILAAANIAGNTYRATWTAARRRRKARLNGEVDEPLSLSERENDSGRWRGTAALIETEAS